MQEDVLNKYGRITTHGVYKRRIYNIWYNMKSRCNNVLHHKYYRYGGRGIKCEPTWTRFNNFYNDMRKGYQDNLTLNRINNDWGYSKENCNWITNTKQQHNRSDSIIYKGKCIAEWSRELNIPYKTLSARVRYGWDMEKVLNSPVRKYIF